MSRRKRSLGGKKMKGRHLGFLTVTDGRGGKKRTDTLHLTHCLHYLLLSAALSALAVICFLLRCELGHRVETFGEQRSISEKLRDECKQSDKEMSKWREPKEGGVDGADEEQRLRDMFMFKRREEDGINEGLVGSITRNGMRVM